MDLDYQTDRHLEMAVRQWPRIDREAARREIRRRLLDGQAWLWPEPMQLHLFGLEAA